MNTKDTTSGSGHTSYDDHLFADLGLGTDLMRVIFEKGFDSPTPVQKQAIPAILKGADILATARTGSGKTAAFVLPVLELLSATSIKSTTGPKVMILTPTRELAKQIAHRINEYSTYLDLRYALIYGGVSQQKQEFYLSKNPEIIIATPGRLMDLMNQKIVNLELVRICIADEADRMLDMGFIDDIRFIMKPMPADRQILMFSATMSDEIETLAEEIMVDPKILAVDSPATTVNTIDSKVYFVEEEDKYNLLYYLMQNYWMEKILIFVQTRKDADIVAKQLYKEDFKVGVIHSEKTQKKRELALKFFKQGRIRILVATDVASRGIDIDDITHIINYHVPEYTEDYIHRIGRTGRAGREGTAYTFCASDEHRFFYRIEKLIRQMIPEADKYPFKSRTRYSRDNQEQKDQEP